jgi:hypothetical protein
VRLRYVIFPWWSLACLTALAPTLWLGRRARTHRRPGLCPQCGYDLRATPGEGGALLSRCPECGAVPTLPAAGKGAA